MKRMTILIFLLSIVIESLNAQPFLTQEHWEKYFYDKASNIDPIEGLWNVSFQQTTRKKRPLALAFRRQLTTVELKE